MRTLKAERDAKIAELIELAIAKFEGLTPEQQDEYRRAQRRSWVLGELMLENPDMTRDEAERWISEPGMGEFTPARDPRGAAWETNWAKELAQDEEKATRALVENVAEAMRAASGGKAFSWENAARAAIAVMQRHIIEAIEDERLADPQDDTDAAYNAAIGDALDAVKYLYREEK
jgi:hypothetical protein